MTTRTGRQRESAGVKVNRFTLSLSKHWLRYLLVVIGLYAMLPFAAPVFMHVGLTGPGELIYTIYSPMCHQFAFRSWFLFGEQPAYPRAQAHVAGLQPYESFAADINQGISQPVNLNNWTLDLMTVSKSFIGNSTMGYKIAICERDVAIYGTLFIAGLVYAIPFVRRRLRPAPIWLYVLVGLVPIGIDGFSQLLSQPPFSLWPARESTPIFRTLTGACFGLMNAWLAYPYLEASARDVVIQLEKKFAVYRRRQRTQNP